MVDATQKFHLSFYAIKGRERQTWQYNIEAAATNYEESLDATKRG